MGFIRQSGSDTAKSAAAIETQDHRQFGTDTAWNRQRSTSRLFTPKRFRHKWQRCHRNSDDGWSRSLVLRRPGGRRDFLLSTGAFRPWIYCSREGNYEYRVIDISKMPLGKLYISVRIDRNLQFCPGNCPLAFYIVTCLLSRREINAFNRLRKCGSNSILLCFRRIRQN